MLELIEDNLVTWYNNQGLFYFTVVVLTVLLGLKIGKRWFIKLEAFIRSVWDDKGRQIEDLTSQLGETTELLRTCTQALENVSEENGRFVAQTLATGEQAEKILSSLEDLEDHVQKLELKIKELKMKMDYLGKEG